MLSACGSTGGPRTVVLDVPDSAFSPSTVTVRQGEVVRFVLRNRDPSHELIVGDHQVQDRHEHGTESDHGDRPGAVSVAAGATAETTYTFSTRGQVLVGCHLPDHWHCGRRGAIPVV